MSKFDGNVVIRLVVDNYDFQEVREQLTEKLFELDFVVVSTIFHAGMAEN